MRLTFDPLNGVSPIAASGTVNPDGTFDIRDLMPGLYRMSMTIAPPRPSTSLWLRSATLDGRELLDSPIDMESLGSVTDVVAALSDRHTELSGVLQTADGQPDRDDTVMVFPADRGLWQRWSRRIRAARTAIDGRYAFVDLPPGDYILAPVTDATSTVSLSAELLEQMVSAGVKVTIGEGERKTQDLRVR